MTTKGDARATRAEEESARARVNSARAAFVSNALERASTHCARASAPKVISRVSASSMVTLESCASKAKASKGTTVWGRYDTNASRGRVRMKDEEREGNRGVEARARRDEGEREEKKDARATLERKARTYDALARGEIVDDIDAYEVDFATKSGFSEGDREMRGESARWEAMVDAEEAAAERAARERAVIFEIERDTERARDSAAAAKRSREDIEVNKRARLKAAFLKAHVAKMKKVKS